MSDTLRVLQKYLAAYFCKFNAYPKVISITPSEAEDLGFHPQFQIPITPSPVAEVYGSQVWESPYADLQRIKTLTFSTMTLQVERITKAGCDCLLEKAVISDMKNEMRYLLRGHVLSDTTSLTLKLEWDSMAGLKRLLHVTKWFPVKHKEYTIQGRVLYPFLKVQLPNHVHTVQFFP